MEDRAKPLRETRISLPIAGDESATNAVRDVEAHDLVIAVAGHAGSGTSRVAKKLEAELKLKGFSASVLRLSKLIEIACAPGPTNESSHDRTRRLQESGTTLRKDHGEDIVAALAIRAMHESRAAGSSVHAFILDSLKHPRELELLRAVYKSSFYLVGVICHEDVRKGRLELKYKDAEDGTRESIQLTDEDDPRNEGQQVRKVLHLADYFINNDAHFDTSKPDPLADSVSRFVRLVTESGIERPTRDESGMFAAWGASLSSACLSRQVGAAILDARGTVISTGANEVPKFGGGAYDAASEGNAGEAEGKIPVPRGRCFHAGKCFNDAKKQEMYAEVFSALREHFKDETVEAAVTKALRGTRIGALLEFSRAVHAEMDAVISIARRGGPPLVGASLYCRTYPCHNCARHIVAAGIIEVVYVEPYQKSLAAELHADSIREAKAGESAVVVQRDEKKQPDEKNERRQVVFRLFSGVAPRRYSALFEEKRDLKNPSPSKQPRHRDYVHSISYREIEEEIAKKVGQVLEGTSWTAGA